MHPKNLVERITFLKRNLTENSFGERIENYSDVGKGWAAIKFKSAVPAADNKPAGIVYQVTLPRPIPKFHRLMWRNQEYNLVSDFIIESGYHMVTVLIQETIA
jgi:head-tail adaptor